MMELLAQSQNLGNWLMAAAVGLMTISVVISLRKRVGRTNAEPDLTPHEKLERIKQTAGMKDDLRTMMVELEELTRRFSSQLDAKSMHLERLIEEADRRIARLNAGESPLAGSKMIGRSARPAEAAKGASRPRPAQPATSVATSEDSVDATVSRIYELADAGRTPVQIAGELQEQVGKVELILALRRT
jgi:TolA-binding protein